MYTETALLLAPLLDAYRRFAKAGSGPTTRAKTGANIRQPCAWFCLTTRSVCFVSNILVLVLSDTVRAHLKRAFHELGLDLNA